MIIILQKWIKFKYKSQGEQIEIWIDIGTFQYISAMILLCTVQLRYSYMRSIQIELCNL